MLRNPSFKGCRYRYQPLHAQIHRGISNCRPRPRITSAAAISTGILAGLGYTIQTIFGDNVEPDLEHDGKANDHSTLRSVLRNISLEARDRFSHIPPEISPVDLLRNCEIRGIISGDTGISRFDVINVPSGTIFNTPYSINSVTLSTGNSWTFFSLLTARNGVQNAEYLRVHLLRTLLDNLLSLFSRYDSVYSNHTVVGDSLDRDSEPISEALDREFKETFMSLDAEIVNQGAERALAATSRSDAVRHLETAYSATSVSVAMFDSSSRVLKVGLAGDGRVVLGRPMGLKNGKEFYSTHVLNTHHSITDPTETNQRGPRHPDESCIPNGLSLGEAELHPRSFGDAAYKLSPAVQDRLHKECLGDPPPPGVKTPPCVTAEPEVTMFDVKPGDFLVMGSGGLFQSLTNDEVVGLVGLWLSNQQNPFDRDTILTAATEQCHVPNPRIIRREELPVAVHEDNTILYSKWRAEKKFIVIDDNAATHLARNALGGADRDLTAALLGIYPPRSYRFRRDINAAVVFFEPQHPSVHMVGRTNRADLNDID